MNDLFVLKGMKTIMSLKDFESTQGKCMPVKVWMLRKPRRNEIFMQNLP